jgi:uncharacterized protein (DUF58 family)
MLVPSSRLLFLVAVIGIPLFTVLGLAEAPAVVIVGLVILLLLILALDAPSAAQAIRLIKIEMESVLRVSKGREIEITGVLINPKTRCRTVRIGLPIPKEFDCVDAIQTLNLQRESERNRMKWKVKALERGNYVISQCYIEGTSSLGLWNGRRAVKCNVELRVYPDLSREKNVLAPLFFRRSAVGMHQVRQIGKGREFEQLRAYAPGDSYEDIYWKGTAKRRYPVTKMFQLERTQEVYVVLDASRRSARTLDSLTGEEAGIIAKTQLERFIQAALVLALASEQQTDRFGLIVFSDQVHRIIPAAGGRSHYDTVRDSLYSLQPKVVSPDYEDVFIHIGNRLRQRALLIFLTDLGEPWLAESFVEGIGLVSRKHVVLTHMLGQRDIRPLFAKEDAVADADELYGRLAGQLLWNDFQETTRLLKQRGVHLTSSLQENLVADVVSEYLKVKKRQLI